MRIIWITRSFLDYRIAVFKELNKLTNGEFYLLYNKIPTPERVINKVEIALGKNAIGFTNEISVGNKFFEDDFANRSIRIPFQPGLIKKAKQLKPDIIITDGFFQWTYAALFLRAFHRIPHLMLYERTSYIERHAQWYRTNYRKFVLKWIDAIGCSGELCAEYVIKLGFSRDKISFGHMVADTVGLSDAIQRIDKDRINDIKLNLGISNTVYLYSGQMIPRKGVKELLKAWKKFNIKDATLLLCGEGPYRSEYEIYAKKNELKNVIFLGYVSYDLIHEYYSIADIFIIPTLEDNWSLVVSEAMSIGLPVVTTFYNGCYKELVTPKNGWVFDPLDENDFIRVLNETYNQKDSFKEKGINSKAIIEKYTPQSASLSIYSECIKILDK